MADSNSTLRKTHGILYFSTKLTEERGKYNGRLTKINVA